MKITGFFANIKRANETIDELKKSGFMEAIVDINEHYMDERNVQTNLPGTETSPSLSGLVLESDMHVVDRSKAPLTAASPMVSGFGRFEEVADANCRVIVEVDENDANRVKQIIKNMGGDLDNPNVDMPKNLHRIDI